jgi:hypothetical protein
VIVVVLVVSVPADWRAHLQRVEQLARDCRYVSHRSFEGRLVRLGGRLKAADLPDELEGGVAQLLVAGSVIRVPQAFDVSTHDLSVEFRFVPELHSK